MQKQMIAVMAGLAMVLFCPFSYAGDFLPGSFADVVKKVTPAVVNIVVTGDGSAHQERNPRRPVPPGPFGEPPEGAPPGEESPPVPPPMPGTPGRPDQSSGSGVIIDAEGYIVTNNHVVGNATLVTVTLKDKREFRAQIVGTDPKTDLAVIKIDAKNLPYLKWADYEKLQVGDFMLAVGSPFGLSSTVTMGIISALGRGNVGIADYEDFIQTDAAINPGNSGGALVNMKSELAGINTAIFSRTGGSEGIGFAIPSSIALDIVESLIKTGKVVRGWMGVSIQEITPALAKSFKIPDQQRGVMISDVNEKGPAWTGGLKRGDVVISFNEKEIQNVSQLRNMVARAPVGHTVKLKVLRSGKEQTIEVKVAERPSDEELGRVMSPKSGPKTEPQSFNNFFNDMRVEHLTADMRSQLNLPEKIAGVAVVAVKPGSSMEGAGVQRGDVIFEINHKVVKDVAEYNVLAKSVGEKESAVLSIVRQGNKLYIAVIP